MALRRVALVVALGLMACAAPLRSFSDLEQARIDEYERAARQILESRGIQGPPPAVRVGEDPALSAMARPAAYFTPRTGFGDLGRPGRIMINRAVVADDLIAQAVLSHELAHFVLGHGDGRCQSHRHECEVEASVASGELLMTGWALDYGDAVRLQYATSRAWSWRSGGRRQTRPEWPATPAGSSRSSRPGSRPPPPATESADGLWTLSCVRQRRPIPSD